jgi:hypothetical protein
MINIGKVIGWKFSHQQGMETKDGVITKFPNGIPSQDNQDLWVSEYNNYLDREEIKRKIIALDIQITTRNLIGLSKGDQYAINKINNIESQIESLRGQL